MLALAFLTVTAATEHASPPSPPGQIPLTRNEIARLITSITQPARDRRHLLHWSHWRRRHQHRAKTSHYQRQAAQDPDRDGLASRPARASQPQQARPPQAAGTRNLRTCRRS